jgi:flagellar biosynthesis protein FliR
MADVTGYYGEIEPFMNIQFVVGMIFGLIIGFIIAWMIFDSLLKSRKRRGRRR